MQSEKGTSIMRNVGIGIFKFRYLIAAVLLLICVVFQLSGSSIGSWSLNLAGTYEDNSQDMSGDLLGEYRTIRTDEWAVNTPMAFSQNYNYSGAYPYFSDTIRGDKTDTFIIYGQPVKSWEIIFRPFQIGYLFLGPSGGLSFFWCTRLIVLLLVSIEFGMYLTGKKKLLSLAYALFVAFSPVVSWWFAINGLVEMLIFGQLALLLAVKWMYAKKRWAKALLTLGIAWCGIAYVLIFYPPWQIPLGYVYLFLLLGIILKERKNVLWHKGEIALSLVLLITVMAGVLGGIFLKSKETIELIMNTSYPGTRSFTGGDALSRLFNWPAGIFFPYIDPGLGATNVCEQAAFFSFFPFSIILGGWRLLKKKEPLLIIMMAGTCFLAAYSAIPWPAWLAKITLLGMCQGQRAVIGAEFLSIILIIYVISLGAKEHRMLPGLAVSAVGSVALAAFCLFVNPTFMGEKRALTLCIMIAAGMFCILLAQKRKQFLCLAVYAIILAIAGGVNVNPLHKGDESIYASKLTKEIMAETKQDQGKGLWIVEKLPMPYQNLPLMAGAPTINSTNVYPDLERWNKLDPEKKHEYTYNRYAHITVNLVEDDTKVPTFRNTAPDQLLVSLKTDQLELLKVRHILTDRDLSRYEGEDIQFEKVKKVGKYYIYNVSYS